MQVQIDRYQSDLNTDYHEIEKRYEDQFIQLKVYYQVMSEEYKGAPTNHPAIDERTCITRSRNILQSA